jgi:ubiquinone/menaquinone biosynthesis C-methylase UbiE
VTQESGNIDEQVVKDFGSEWSRFDQSRLKELDHKGMFESYFHIFPWEKISSDSMGADIGCGSGRWAVLVAPKIGHLHLIDPSEDALHVAKLNLATFGNTSYHMASVDSLPFTDSSLDFAYALGVLHHVPDTRAAIKSIARTLKPGAPFLVYLYYALDQRPWWFRTLWRVSDLARRFISVLPKRAKNICCDLIALTIYLPLARMAWLLDKLGSLPDAWPLSYYRDRDFYVLRTDALDRFGTRLEQRFTRIEIRGLMEEAGFEKIEFSAAQPFWTAVGFKKA